MRINCRARRHKFKGTRPKWSSAAIGLALYKEMIAPWREASAAMNKRIQDQLLEQLFIETADGFALREHQQILGLETQQVTQCQNPSSTTKA